MSTFDDSLVRERLASFRRQFACWGVVAVAWATAAAQAQAAPFEADGPQAMGVIVKLKDGRASGASAARPELLSPQSSQRRRLLLDEVTRRHRVSYLIQKESALGAQVIHRGEPVPLRDAEAEAARLRMDPDVEWAVPNEILKPMSVPPAPVPPTPVPDVQYSGRFWAYSKTDPAAGAGVAGFPEAWAYLATRASLTPTVVAVLDSGVTEATTHPDFAGRLYPGYDFVTDVVRARDGNGRDGDPSDPGDALPGCAGTPADPCSSWHGTSIIGMLAPPAGSTSLGQPGVSQRAGPGILAPIGGVEMVVLPVRVGGYGGAAASDIVEGMFWAAGVSFSGAPPSPARLAKVISISYGAAGGCNRGSGTVDAYYRDAVSVVRSLGVVVVGSAGNGEENDFRGFSVPSRPAGCQGVIAAVALGRDGAKADYSNLADGSKPSQGFFAVAVASGDGNGDRLALLGNTGSSSPGATRVMSGIAGTSFAAPQVAGVAALMFAVNPSLSSVDVATRIVSSATAFPSVGEPTCSESFRDRKSVV